MPFEQRTCRHCGTEFRFMAAPSRVRRGQGKFCSHSCSTTFNRTGKPSNNWGGGRNVKDSGHVLVYCPGDPQARPDGYALEHRLILSRHLGRQLARHEVVHHKDGNPANNSLDNLELLPSQSEHMRRHRAEQRRAS